MPRPLPALRTLARRWLRPAAAALSVLALAAAAFGLATLGPGDGQAAGVIEVAVRPEWVTWAMWAATAVMFGALALVSWERFSRA